MVLSERFLMTQIRLVLMLYFFMGAHKAACQTLLKAFLKSMTTWQRSCWYWRYFSQRICGWRSVLWCFFLLWSLPVLQRWSSPLVTSICSVWSSAWLCSDSWWGWSLSSSGTAVGCLFWEVWWLRTGSKWVIMMMHYIGVTLSVCPPVSLSICPCVWFCPDEISWTTQLLVYDCEMECNAEKLVCYLHGEGHSEGLYNQNMTFYCIF